MKLFLRFLFGVTLILGLSACSSESRSEFVLDNSSTYQTVKYTYQPKEDTLTKVEVTVSIDARPDSEMGKSVKAIQDIMIQQLSSLNGVNAKTEFKENKLVTTIEVDFTKVSYSELLQSKGSPIKDIFLGVYVTGQGDKPSYSQSKALIEGKGFKEKPKK